MNRVFVNFERSDGKKFTLGNADWRIPNDGLTGFDYPTLSVFSEQNGIGDGAILSGKRVEAREPMIKAKSMNPKENALNRAKALAFFLPQYTYRIHVHYLGVERWVEGEIEGFSCPTENIHRPLTLTVKFLCVDPFLKSEDNFGRDLAGKTGMLAFPWIHTKAGSTPYVPIVASVFDFNRTVNILNDGDIQTFASMVIRINGTVVNPCIYKDGEYVRIIRTFHAGDVIDIDFKACTIRMNGESIIQYIDKNSAFTEMALQVGDNSIGYRADEGDAEMSVTLYFNKEYIGL